MNAIILEFENVSERQANIMALDLQTYLERNTGAEVHVNKQQNYTMDFGTILEVILSAGSSVAIAKGIANWMSRKGGVRLTIKNKNGEIIAENISSDHVPSIVQAAVTQPI